MASKTPRWLLGCGLGCLIVFILGLGLTGFGTVWVWGLFDQVEGAIEVRKEVEERFDRPETFTPEADGAIPPERLERFLDVRRALEPLCSRFDATVGRIEELEDQPGDEAPALVDIFGVLTGAMGFPRLMADYMDARNQALLGAEVGLGEYTYIYVVAYAAGERERGRDAQVGRILSRRVRDGFIGMLTRQRDLLGGDPEAAAVLESEIEALRDDAGRWPWQEGLPGSITDSLRDRADELARLDCPHEAEFALGRARREGMSIHGD